MRSFAKPRALRQGDRIGVCAPAGPVDAAGLERGLEELRGLGFEPVVSASILEREGFTAGSAERRLEELYESFEDPKIAGVFAARGGAGLVHLLPRLDVARLVADPKLLLGYSDLTFLHVLLNNAGLVTFHGPMVSREMADQNYDRESLLAAVTGDVDHQANETCDLLALREGRAEGRLVGGCLSILCAGIGTPWALRVPEDEDEKILLLLEDVSEAPYRVDRMLRQLRAASFLDRVGGIVFGEMVDCWPDVEAEFALEDVILQALDGLDIPIAIGLPSGHCPQGLTLPLGVTASLDCQGDAGRFEVLESGVSLKIHLSAICGTAMASLAGLLRDKGHDVTGSDQDVYPPMSTQLAALGIPVLSPYAESNVPADADLVVIGNALSRGNPEVEVVLDRGQRFTSMPAQLAEEFIRGRTSVVVAGTHGKTTTTSLVAFLLDEAGLEPSFLIGGIPKDFARSYRLARGRHFVVEGDEYDCAFFDKRPKFVHYMPEIAVIGNVEYDHADIYPDMASVETAFRRLVDVVPRRGLVVAGAESPALPAILERARCRVQTFAIDGAADWRAVEVTAGERGARFRLLRGGADAGVFELSLHGRHNVRNALAALAVANAAGVSPETVRQLLPRFSGVKRRLELVGRSRAVAVYDDFAHHPTAVRETLLALRASEATAIAAGGRLIVVFEPRSYTSRTKVFESGFAQAFTLADEAIVSAAHLPGKVPEPHRLSEARLVEAIQHAGGRARLIPGVQQIVEDLARSARPNDVVAILSNGGFEGIHGRLLAALAAT